MQITVKMETARLKNDLHFPVDLLTTFSATEGFFFLRRENVWELVGTSSPSNSPQGCRPSTRSKMIFKMPTKGIDRNMPATPHKAPPSKTATMEMRALIFTLEETIRGTRMLLSIN